MILCLKDVAVCTQAKWVAGRTVQERGKLCFASGQVEAEVDKYRWHRQFDIAVYVGFLVRVKL